MGILVRVITVVFLLAAMVGVSYGQLPPVQLNPANLNRNAPPQKPGNPPQTERVTERQAVALARQQFPGNILRVSLVGEGANQRYQIRMENEGKVFTVFVHATTGQVTGGS